MIGQLVGEATCHYVAAVKYIAGPVNGSTYQSRYIIRIINTRWLQISSVCRWQLFTVCICNIGTTYYVRETCRLEVFTCIFILLNSYCVRHTQFEFELKFDFDFDFKLSPSATLCSQITKGEMLHKTKN